MSNSKLLRGECLKRYEETRVEDASSHSSDDDCQDTIDDDCCTVCGVSHGEPCDECGGRGYHDPDCAECG